MPDILQMLSGGDAYKESMKDFQRNGKLFPVPYKPLIRHLYTHAGLVIKSKDLARMFFPGKKPEDAGVYIRDIIRHARRCGHKIASSAHGYWHEPCYENLVENCRHMEARAFDLLFTVGRMKKLCRKEKQMKMRLAV